MQCQPELWQTDSAVAYTVPCAVSCAVPCAVPVAAVLIFIISPTKMFHFDKIKFYDNVPQPAGYIRTYSALPLAAWLSNYFKGKLVALHLHEEPD